MSGVESVLLGLATYLIATASPGPATMAIMTVSADHGRKAGLQLATGVMCGSLFWGLCAAFGLATVISNFADLFMVIKILGGLYLLWLAYKAVRSALTTDAAFAARPIESSRSFVLQGLAIHLTNPKAVLAWVAIYSIGVQPGAPVWHILIMFTGCVVLGITIFFGYALLFSTHRAQAVYIAVRRPINGLLGAVFGAAGLKLVLERN